MVRRFTGLFRPLGESRLKEERRWRSEERVCAMADAMPQLAWMARANEASVGDKVPIDYYLGVGAEIRPPTNAEKANPLKVLDTTKVRTGRDVAPSAYDLRQVRAVVTIEALDKAAQTVTVKGPCGQYYTARVKDPSRLDKVRIGESILMTFTEATAVSLKPAAD